jgi:S-adenosyl-L-methionine hydrolase (adenosine-forming)
MAAHIVTFLSDFGLRDGYVAQVKARILSSRPTAVIVDITHDVEPCGILSAGWILSSTYHWFPPGSMHLCIVDPGVGTERQALVVQKGPHLFVGPDNGVFSFLYPADAVTCIDWRPGGPVSPTFHGRDLFAPVVAELLKGMLPASLGHGLDEPVSVDLSRHLVVHIDRFGTLVTNIPSARLDEGCFLQVGNTRVSVVVQTFARIHRPGPALVPGSAGTVEVAVNMGSAAHALGARVGMEVVFGTDQRE